MGYTVRCSIVHIRRCMLCRSGNRHTSVGHVFSAASSSNQKPWIPRSPVCLVRRARRCHLSACILRKEGEACEVGSRASDSRASGSWGRRREQREAAQEAFKKGDAVVRGGERDGPGWS